MLLQDYLNAGLTLEEALRYTNLLTWEGLSNGTWRLLGGSSSYPMKGGE